MCVQSCPTFCDSTDYSPPGSTGKNAKAGCRALFQGIFQAPGIEFPSLSSPALQVDSLTAESPGKPQGHPRLPAIIQ